MTLDVGAPLSPNKQTNEKEACDYHLQQSGNKSTSIGSKAQKLPFKKDDKKLE